MLCAERDFGGSPDDLTAARRAISIPALAKDFTVFPEQVARQRIAGADAVLVILGMVCDDEARRLSETAGLLGMDVLVEANDAAEVERAIALGPRIVGVNARNLETLEVDRDGQLELLASLPEGVAANRRVRRRVARRRRGRAGRRRPRRAGRDVADALARAARRAGGGAAMTLVKICGLTREQDVDPAVEAGADLVGFVCVAGSPRGVEPSSARPSWHGARRRSGVRTSPCIAGSEPDGPTDGFDLVQVYGPSPRTSGVILGFRGAPPDGLPDGVPVLLDLERGSRPGPEALRGHWARAAAVRGARAARRIARPRQRRRGGRRRAPLGRGHGARRRGVARRQGSRARHTVRPQREGGGMTAPEMPDAGAGSATSAAGSCRRR